MWRRRKASVDPVLEPVAEGALEPAAENPPPRSGPSPALSPASSQAPSPTHGRSPAASSSLPPRGRSPASGGGSSPSPGRASSSPSGMPEPKSTAQSIHPVSPLSPQASPFDKLSFAVDFMAAKSQRKRYAREGGSPPPMRLKDKKPDLMAGTSGTQLQEYLQAALGDHQPEAEEERRRSPLKILTESLNSLDLSSRFRRCLHCLRGCPASTAEWVRRSAAFTDESVHQWKTSRLRRRVQEELLRMAVEAGDMPQEALPGRFCSGKASSEDLERLRFSPPYVVEAFRRVRPPPKKPFMEKALDGELHCREIIGVLTWTAVFVMLVLFFLYLGLAVAMFSAGDLARDPAAGALVHADDRNLTAAAAATVKLKPLWDYPTMPLWDLQTAEDVVFVHNQATHMLRVATVSKTASGSVLLKATDGSTVRVTPNSAGFWTPAGNAEVYLQGMETWRATERNTEVQWLTSGLLAAQVTIPM
mmetsp:Transcript_123456/g.384258  ORF Transcript_123456/g.384258 Transcript_123456/m.384258 type:complete len:475 (+) Transcript_123456:59-1483(+)